MGSFKNALEVFKLLDKSNCRDCGKQNCMAFAADVFTGQKKLGECTHLKAEILVKYTDNEKETNTPDDEFTLIVSQLKKDISQIDLSNLEKVTGGYFHENKLTLKVLGKDFSIDINGDITTDIHVNPWIVIPVFSYILTAAKSSSVQKGAEGESSPGKSNEKWITIREMQGGQERFGLFTQRVEKNIKKVADSYPELFEDMIRLFNGKQVENHYKSDISLILYPLPKIPILFCYWYPDDGLESDLKIFFGSYSESYLSSEIIYTLVAGLGNMFEKIALTHMNGS